MALLAAASGGFMVSMSVRLGPDRPARSRAVVVGWFAGVVTFPIVVSLIDDLFLRVAVGLAAGSCVAAATMATLLYARLAAEEGAEHVAPGAPPEGRA